MVVTKHIAPLLWKEHYPDGRKILLNQFLKFTPAKHLSFALLSGVSLVAVNQVGDGFEEFRHL